MTSQPKTVWTRKQVIEATGGHCVFDSVKDWSAEGISICLLYTSDAADE